MADILGPSNAPYAVTIRPPETRTPSSGDTFFRDCTSSAAQDGTKIQAAWLNQVTATLRGQARMVGKKLDGTTLIIPEDNSNDAILADAIRHTVQRGQMSTAADTGSANAAAVSLAPAPAELISGMRISVLKSGAANTGAVTLAVNGGAATPVVWPDGSALAAGDWPASARALLEYDSALVSWVLLSNMGPSVFARVSAVRKKLTGDMTFYTSASGSDVTGAGTAVSPWLTLQKAINTVLGVYDLNGYTARIQSSNGSYAGFGFDRPPMNGYLDIVGNVATPSACVITSTCAVANAGISISGFTFQTSSGPCLAANIGSSIHVTGPVIFGAASGAHQQSSEGGIILVSSSYTITGGATSHFLAQGAGSEIIFGAGGVVTATVTGTPNFSSSFATSFLLGNVYASPGCVITGAATGQRYSVQTNAIIATNGGGPNYFPGTIAGVNNGGSYT